MSRQYLVAGKCVEAVIFDHQPFKRYCAKMKKMGTEEYLLAAETLKYADILQELLSNSDTVLSELDVNRGIFLVMAYELLFGKGKIKGGGQVKRVVVRHMDALSTELVTLMRERGVKQKEELLPERLLTAARMPTYVRVNELKLKISEGLALIQKACPEAQLDDLIRGLVRLPPGAPSLGQSAAVKDGQLIIQDKASCIPSQTLADQWEGGDVIDACAAPGNKTSHVAARLFTMNDEEHSEAQVTITAFDRNARRAALLRRRLDEAGAHAVNVLNEDFLAADVTSPAFSRVRSVLCDPSCSGSGLVRSLDRAGDASAEASAANDPARLESLQRLQVSVVSKAMSFPLVRHVVYSTCSVHAAENEDVVAEVLRAHPGWDVMCPPSMAQWKRRGQHHAELSQVQSSALIRCEPEDGLNGFFVANFVFVEKREPEAKRVRPTPRRYLQTHTAGEKRPSLPVKRRTDIAHQKPWYPVSSNQFILLNF